MTLCGRQGRRYYGHSAAWETCLLRGACFRTTQTENRRADTRAQGSWLQVSPQVMRSNYPSHTVLLPTIPTSRLSLNWRLYSLPNLPASCFSLSEPYVTGFPLSVLLAFSDLASLLPLGLNFLSSYFLFLETPNIPRSNPAVPSREQFCPPRDIWQGLETALIVTVGEMLLASGGKRPEMGLNILPMSRQPHPEQRVIRSKCQ